MNKVNSIVICRDEYENEEGFRNAIKDAIMVLLNNNYIMTVRWDEKGLGIVSIDYNHADQSYGDIYPYWLTYEQAYAIQFDKEE